MKDWRTILEDEGLGDWTTKDDSSGLCMHSQKVIFCIPNDNSLFLHELAHAKTHKWNEKMGDKTGHHAIWADEYTNLVRKYLCTPSSLVNK